MGSVWSYFAPEAKAEAKDKEWPVPITAQQRINERFLDECAKKAKLLQEEFDKNLSSLQQPSNDSIEVEEIVSVEKSELNVSSSPLPIEEPEEELDEEILENGKSESSRIDSPAFDTSSPKPNVDRNYSPETDDDVQEISEPAHSPVQNNKEEDEEEEEEEEEEEKIVKPPTPTKINSKKSPSSSPAESEEEEEDEY